MEEKKERDSPPTRVKGEGTVCKRLALGGVCVCVRVGMCYCPIGERQQCKYEVYKKYRHVYG